MNKLARVLVLCALSACARNRKLHKDIEPTPPWASEKGRVKAKMELVAVLLDSGTPEAALSLIGQLRSEGVDGAEIDVMQGQGLREIGLVDDAEQILAEVVDRHPKDAEAHNQLGILKLDQHRFDEAIDHFQRAVKFQEDNAHYVNNLGFAYLSAGRPEEAVVALRRSLKLDASSQLTRNNLGYALVASRQDKEAFRVFRAAGSEADAHYNLAVGLELRGDTDEAIREYGLAVRSNAQHYKAHEALKRLEGEADSSVDPTADVEAP